MQHRLQWEIRKIKIEYIKSDIGKHKQRGNDMHESPQTHRNRKSQVRYHNKNWLAYYQKKPDAVKKNK